MRSVVLAVASIVSLHSATEHHQPADDGDCNHCVVGGEDAIVCCVNPQRGRQQARDSSAVFHDFVVVLVPNASITAVC